MSIDRDPQAQPASWPCRPDPQRPGLEQRRALLTRTVTWPLAWRIAGLTTTTAATIAADPAPVQAATPQAGTDAPAASYIEAILAFTSGALPRPGRVRLDVAVLVDNGNTVPIAVSVEPSPAAGHGDQVSAIAVFSERNPQHEVIRFQLGPGSAGAELGTRIRLATSQKLMAVARLADGSHWSHEVEVIVTLAACIEGDG